MCGSCSSGGVQILLKDPEESVAALVETLLKSAAAAISMLVLTAK